MAYNEKKGIGPELESDDRNVVSATKIGAIILAIVVLIGLIVIAAFMRGSG